MRRFLMTASSLGHFEQFHLPYFSALEEQGILLDIACPLEEGVEKPLGVHEFYHVPFKKSVLALDNFKAMFQLKELITENQYDTVIVHTSLASFFTRMAIKGLEQPPFCICMVHGYLFHEFGGGFSNFILKTAEEMVAGQTDLLLTMNNWDYDHALAQQLGKDVRLIQGIGVKEIVYESIYIDTHSEDYHESPKKEKEAVEAVEEVEAPPAEAPVNSALSAELASLEPGFTPFDPSAEAASPTEEVVEEVEEVKEVVSLESLKETFRSSLPFASNSFILMFGGEFSKRKNQKFLIEAMTSLPDKICLLLAGDGEYLEECKNLVIQLKLGYRVFFLGHVHNLPTWYKMADIVVSASISEGLPVHLMEALTVGSTVVVSDVKGHHDLILDSQNGLLFPLGDMEKYVKQITRVYVNDNLRYLFADQGQQLMEQYSLETVMPELMKLYLQDEHYAEHSEEEEVEANDGTE